MANFSILQAVGNLSGGAEGISVSISPQQPGVSAIWLVGIGSTASPSSFSSADGLTITPIGTETQIGATDSTILQAVALTSAADTLTLSASSFITGLIAVEVAGLAGEAPVAFLTLEGAYSGGIVSSGDTGSLSGVPLAVLALGFCVQTPGTLTGAGPGFAGSGVTWQGTAPAAGQVVLESLELEADGATAATFESSYAYDDNGIALAVFAEQASVPGYVPFAEWNAGGPGFDGALVNVSYPGGGVSVQQPGYVSLAELYPQALGTSGTVVVSTDGVALASIDVAAMTRGVPVRLPGNICRRSVGLSVPQGTAVSVKW